MASRGRPPKQVPPRELTGDDELLTTEEAAKLTKVSVSWYQNKRYEGVGGPLFIRRGRIVRYVKKDLLAWWVEFMK
jgi:hypothetical protein